MTRFDAAQWWASLTETEQALACAHRADDPLPAEVVNQLRGYGVMTGETNPRSETTARWHWTTEVQEFLDKVCEQHVK